MIGGTKFTDAHVPERLSRTQITYGVPRRTPRAPAGNGRQRRSLTRNLSCGSRKLRPTSISTRYGEARNIVTWMEDTEGILEFFGWNSVRDFCGPQAFRDREDGIELLDIFTARRSNPHFRFHLALAHLMTGDCLFMAALLCPCAGYFREIDGGPGAQPSIPISPART